MKTLILAALLMTGCETIYHHNTVHQVDVVYDDTADVYVADDADDTADVYCDRRFCL